ARTPAAASPSDRLLKQVLACRPPTCALRNCARRGSSGGRAAGGETASAPHAATRSLRRELDVQVAAAGVGRDVGGRAESGEVGERERGAVAEELRGSVADLELHGLLERIVGPVEELVEQRAVRGAADDLRRQLARHRDELDREREVDAEAEHAVAL